MAQAPETVGAMYSCSHCGVRFASINASFTHRCPNVTRPTLTGVTEVMRSANATFDWIRAGEVGEIVITFPVKVSKASMKRAEQALLGQGWKLSCGHHGWTIRY